MRLRNLVISISTIALLCAAFFVIGAGKGTKTFLEEEAGISAYVNIGQVDDLTMAREAYRTVEKETDEYIVGSVAIPGYDEIEDAHVYVSKDGWIVAYYSKDEPVSKMVDSKAYQNTGVIKTKLETALGIMCSQLGKGLPDVKYYDFRAPKANKLMIICDKDGQFEVKIPDDIAVSRMSRWHGDKEQSIGGRWWDAGEFYIDGDKIEDAKITLSKGVSHTIIGTYPLGIVLVYKEP